MWSAALARAAQDTRHRGHAAARNSHQVFKTATYGETIEVHTSVDEWRAKTFTHRHIVRRGDDVLCEGTEVRAFVTKDPANPERIKAIPIPDDIKALCSP